MNQTEQFPQYIICLFCNQPINISKPVALWATSSKTYMCHCCDANFRSSLLEDSSLEVYSGTRKFTYHDYNIYMDCYFPTEEDPDLHLQFWLVSSKEYCNIFNLSGDDALTFLTTSLHKFHSRLQSLMKFI